MNKKLTKVITLILSCLLLIGAAVGITVSANDAGDTPSVEIVNKNVAYEGAVQLVFALKVNNLENSGLTAKVVFDADVALDADVDELENGYVKSSPGSLFVGEGETQVEYPLVYSNGIVAKELRKAVVATPVLVDAEGVVKYVGASVDYSPFVYAMNRFDNAQSSAAQIELYKALLDYGAAVQDLLSDSYEDKEATVASWGGWADKYYNVVYTDAVKNVVYNYAETRAADFEEKGLPLVVEADKFAVGKIFTGFKNGSEQVFHTGVTSSTWNKYDVKPGGANGTVNVVATYVDGTNPYEQFNTATTLPDWAYLNNPGTGAPADPIAKGYYSWFEDGEYKIGKYKESYQHFYINPAGTAAVKTSAETYRNSGLTVPAASANYEFDIRLDSAENLRPGKDSVVFFINVYSATEADRASNKHRPTAFTCYYKDGKWDMDGKPVAALGETINLRFEFTQHPTLAGYVLNVYANGKLVNNYSMSSTLRAVTGYSLPVVCIESRYSNASYSSDIFYSIDNLRAEYETCTEHEWEENTNVIYRKSKATCTAQAVYYKSCAKCSFQGTETFAHGDPLPHTPTQIPNRDAIKTDATPSTQAEYYQTCSVCKNLDTTAETFFYGDFDNLENGKFPSFVTGGLVTSPGTSAYAKINVDENGNHYINVQQYNGENYFSLVNDFDPNCVNSVTYEFDYKFNGSSNHASDKGLGWFYPLNKDNTRLNGYHSTLTATSDGTALTAPTSMKAGEWHRFKIVLTKVVDETTGDITSFVLTAYIDGKDVTSTFVKIVIPYDGVVPGIGYLGRSTGISSHDFDNIYVYADHGDAQINEDTTAEGAIASEADCMNPAVYHKSCANCGIIPERFAYGEAGGHSFVNVVSDAALKVPATANKFAVYYKSCSVCGVLSEETFEGEWLDDFTDGVLPDSIYDKKMTATVKYQSETGRNYVTVSSTGEKVFIMDGDFDYDCVETVTYEFDYRFGGSTSKRTNDEISFFWFFNPANLNSGTKVGADYSNYGRLGYYGLRSSVRENATSATLAAANRNYTFDNETWHNIKVVMTKISEENGGGFNVAMYIDGSSESYGATASSHMKNIDYVPLFGLWGSGSVTWSHDFDNVRVYATHSGEVTENATDATLVRNADCSGPAVYNKTCATCGTIPSPFLSGEALDHSYANVVADKFIATNATADAPASYYASCTVCGTLDRESIFSYGQKDYLANGELYPEVTIGVGSLVTEEPETGNWAIIKQEDGNNFLRAENVGVYSNGTTPKITSTTVENADKHVIEVDFRWLYATNMRDNAPMIFNIYVGNLLIYAANCSAPIDGSSVNIYGKTMKANEWNKLRFEFETVYTDGVASGTKVSYFCNGTQVDLDSKTDALTVTYTTGQKDQTQVAVGVPSISFEQRYSSASNANTTYPGTAVDKEDTTDVNEAGTSTGTVDTAFDLDNVYTYGEIMNP